MVTCHIDGTAHASVEELHAYIRSAYRVSQKAYYTTYHARKDLLTGEAIPFKDAEQYLTTDFTTKVNLRKWLKAQPRETGLAWAKRWLAERKERKGLVYAPSQTELRTLCCPTMPYYESVAAAEGGYYGITAAMGYQPRYTKTPLVFTPLPKDAIIIQDTREQCPIMLPRATHIGKLDAGDYAIAQPCYDTGTRIERKSLGDFCGTLSGKRVVRKGGRKGDGITEDSPFARFERELDRATAAGQYVVMMVEANITDAQRFDYLPQTKWVKASPAYIMHQMRELLVRYPLSFQIVFIDGRRDMAAKMMRVFELGARVRETDLQYWLEEGAL